MSTRARSAWFALAGAASAVLSFALLPLTTRELGPREYGLYALVTAVTAVGSGLGTLGSGYVVYGLGSADRGERPTILTSYLTLSLTITAACGGAIFTVWVVAGDRLGAFGDVSAGNLAFAIATMLLTPAWVLAVDVLTLDQRATAYAVWTLLQFAAASATTLVALFTFDLGVGALFLGAAAGATVAALGAAVTLSQTGVTPPRRERVRALARTVRSFVGAQLSDTGYTLLERTVLTSTSGVAPLGLYTHSQRYRDAVNLGVKSVARAAWPVTLDEARVDQGMFPYTRRVWSGIQAALAVAGVASAFVAEPVIDALTHGRFTPAAAYVPWWLVFVLLQSMAKPHTATVYVHATATVLARLNVGANAVAAAVLAIATVRYGAPGALAAVVAQALSYDLLTYRAARRVGHPPFTDISALAGIPLVILAAVVERHWIDSGSSRILGLLCGVAVAGTVFHRPLLALRRSAVPRRRAGSARGAWRQA